MCTRTPIPRPRGALRRRWTQHWPRPKPRLPKGGHMRRKDKSPRGAVNLDELSPEVRDKIMAKIEPSNEAPLLEMPDVAGNFPATPEGNEALAALVIDVVMKLRAFLEKYGPEIEDLKARFMALPRDKYNRGKTTIAGCRTWEEFCELKLGRTPSALRKAL